MSAVRQGSIFPSTTVALIFLLNLWQIYLFASSFQHSANMSKFICRLRWNWIVDFKWYYTVICLENGESPDRADTIHRYLPKLVLDLTHLWLNLGYQTCISFLLKLQKCFRDFDQVLLNLLLVNLLDTVYRLRGTSQNFAEWNCIP